MKAKVLSRIDISDDLIKVRLRPEENWKHQGGQYLKLAPSLDYDLKPFSIASSPELAPEIELHIRNTHGSTWIEELFIAIKPNSTVEIEGPFDHLNGRLPLEENTVILLAGGTGYAPMKSLLDELLANKNIEHVNLYWGATSSSELYEHDELTNLQSEHPKFHYHGCVSGSSTESNWEGFTGFVHEKVLEDFHDLANTEVLACGPKEMTEAAKQSFFEKGLKEASFIS